MLLLTAFLALQLQITPVVEVSERAMMTLDSIAAMSWWEQLEPGACVTVWEKKADTLVIRAIAPGNVSYRTNMSITWDRTMCGDTLPAIHGHLLGLGAWARPTPVDWVGAGQPYRRAPFMLLLLISDRGVAHQLIPYSVKP